MWMESRNIYYIDLIPIRLSKKNTIDCVSKYYMEVYFYFPPLLPFCKRHADAACIYSVTTLKITIQHFLSFVFIPCFTVLWAGMSVCAAMWWLDLGNWFAWKSHEREDLRFHFSFDGSIHQSHSTCSYKKPWHKEEAVDGGGIKSFHDTTAMWEMVIKS